MIEWMRVMTEWCWFHDGVLAMIVLNAAVMGVETSAEVRARHGWWLLGLNGLVQALFVLEIAVRIVAHWPTPSALLSRSLIERCERGLRAGT